MTTPTPPALRYRNAAQQQAKPCDHCHAVIVWAVTKDSRMPLDAAPTDDGNVLIVADNGQLTATVLGSASARAAYREQGYALYSHHKLTCPNHNLWSRPGGARTKPARTGGRPTIVRPRRR